MVFKKFKLYFILAVSVSLLFPVVSVAGDCSPQARCVFVLGNSITHHGPSLKVDWVGNWGMAASSSENDYVSQLLLRLSESSKGAIWQAHRMSAGVLEKNPELFQLPDASMQIARSAEIVIVQVGDNYKFSTDNSAAFQKKYTDILIMLRPKNGVLACVSTWWTSSEKDKILRDGCLKAGGVFVDISGVSGLPENTGNLHGYLNKGVAAHPGDNGMKVIANKIFNSIKNI